VVFSPDGKWIAYSSDESGSREIYVRDFAPERLPAVGSTMKRVSPNGGDKPRWRRDGQELYYIAPDGHLMAVSVRTAPVFDVVGDWSTNTDGRRRWSHQVVSRPSSRMNLASSPFLRVLAEIPAQAEGVDEAMHDY
jgi:Tol biopolymer transport system component